MVMCGATKLLPHPNNATPFLVYKNNLLDRALRKALNILELFSIDKKDLILAGLVILAILVFIPVFTFVVFANDLTTPQNIINSNNNDHFVNLLFILFDFKQLNRSIN